MADASEPATIGKDTHVADRCNRHAIRAQSGWNYCEQIWIKTIRVDDLNAFAPDFARKSHLLSQRAIAVHASRRVFGDWNVQGFDLFDERPHPAQACYTHIKPRSIEASRCVNELAFRSPHLKVGKKFHNFDFARLHPDSNQPTI